MMIFWWAGKGWKPVAILVSVLIVFGITQAATKSFIGDPDWLWGVALIVAAAINWVLCSEDNKKATSRKMSPNLWKRLYYKPRNRFMSLPSETLAIPMALAGLWYLVRGFLD